MGRRVVRLLKQSLPDAEVLTAGRNAANDLRFDVKAPEDNYAALQGVDVLINTVGPFTYNPAPVVSACLDCDVHYVDIAETAPFMAQAARTGSRAVVPGCSTVPGLIAVLAQHWPGRRVRAQLSIGTANEGSSTLLFSMLDPIGRDGCFRHVWWRDHPGIRPRRYGNYPGAGFEFGFGFDRPAWTTTLWMLAPVVGAIPRGILKAAVRVGNFLTPLARPLGTKLGILSLDALDDAGATVGRIEVRAYNNGLDVPAWPSVWATEALLAESGPANGLSDLVTPDAAEQRLEDAGYEILKIL